MSHVVLGLDIGGANLKAATPNPGGRGVSVPFALWKQPDGLPAALASLVRQFDDVQEFAVTMTGELCDCFETKEAGVNHIVTAVLNVSRSWPVRFWCTDGKFLNSDEARANWNTVAAANWHALATFVGRFAPQGTCLLVDVGSTTADVIPLRGGVPCAVGRTDTERLANRELVYTGMRRTPLCNLLPPGETCAEFFATSHDAHLLLENTCDDPADTDTADGRPATRAFAHARIARMVGGDGTTVSEGETVRLARLAVTRQLELVSNAVEEQVRRYGRPEVVVAGGTGEFLACAAIPGRFEVVSLTDRLGWQMSESAPAFAVATLAREKPI